MPTFRHGKNVNVFIDEFDFSTYFQRCRAHQPQLIPPRLPLSEQALRLT
jgi:hypothetical protein